MNRHNPRKHATPQSDTRGYRRHVVHQFRYRKRRFVRVTPLLLLCGAGLIAVIVGIRIWDYSQSRQEYTAYRPEVAAQLDAFEETQPQDTESPLPTQVAVILPAPTATPCPTSIPFYSEQVRKLQRENKDTVAYLDVIGTSVQYPVVQGADNEYYATHTFTKKKRVAGAIFMDEWNQNTFADFNTVIYGHNMKDGSMFSELREYRHAKFLREHKTIEVTLLHSKLTYKVFAAYQVEDDFDFRGFSYRTREAQAGFLRSITKRSAIKTDTAATVDDTILTLVTCAAENRNWYWIVHAVLVENITEAKE